jgi:hypothetical protein
MTDQVTERAYRRQRWYAFAVTVAAVIAVVIALLLLL